MLWSISFSQLDGDYRLCYVLNEAVSKTKFVSVGIFLWYQVTVSNSRAADGDTPTHDSYGTTKLAKN